jgi:hypothetical protein
VYSTTVYTTTVCYTVVSSVTQAPTDTNTLGCKGSSGVYLQMELNQKGIHNSLDSPFS